MSSSSDDTILPPPRRPINSGGLDGDTSLPSQNAPGIHIPGDVIDSRYTVIREIGRGGMGVVYEVEDAVTSIRYAIKRLLPDVASNEQIVRAFVREGTTAERFSATSRYLVTTKSVGRDSAGFYVLMEMVTSPTLRQILKQLSSGGLQPIQAIPIFASIADALNDMHRSGLIHRDLKPENIFVIESDDSVSVQLVDFGLTRNVSSHTITGLSGAGSLRYMAPELFREEAATAAADVYAFGVIAYELLTGELPSFGDRLTDYVPDAAPELVSLVTVCLAGKPEKRPQSGNQLLSQFASLLVNSDQPKKPAVPTAISEPELAEPQPVQPTIIRTTVSFEGVQVGGIVEVDKVTLVKPYVYSIDIETNAPKPISVLVRWQDQVVFEKQITLVAGINQMLKIPQGYRVECAVPAWCAVQDVKRKVVRFPVTGLLSGSPIDLTYLLVYAGAEFDKLTITPKPGENKLKFKYGIGTLTFVDVPSGCRVLVNGTEKGTAYTVPIVIGVPASLSVRVQDRNRVEVYRETVTLEAGESKAIRVPKPVPATTPVGTTSEQTSTVRPEPIIAVPSLIETATLTRRLLIGGGIAGAIGGGLFVSSRLRGRVRGKNVALTAYIKDLCSIPAGSFQMGSSSGDSDEQPVHRVTLSAFRMGATPVTVAVWKEYCAATGTALPPSPSFGWLDDHPVVNVSWDDIMGRDGFCAWASDDRGFRLTLPTVAQFEYAARGGVDGLEYPWGNSFDDSKLWCSKVSGRAQTAPVKRTSNIYPNKFLLTDMSGNVWQWCSDLYGSYSSESQTNPTGPSSTSDNFCCVRGGSWLSLNPGYFRSANHNGIYPDIRDESLGFRLAAESL